jgi:hypothetical protein
VPQLFSRDLWHSFAEKLGCWKKISAAFREVPKNGVFAGIDYQDILLHVKAMLGPR